MPTNDNITFRKKFLYKLISELSEGRNNKIKKLLKSKYKTKRNAFSVKVVKDEIKEKGLTKKQEREGLGIESIVYTQAKALMDRLISEGKFGRNLSASPENSATQLSLHIISEYNEGRTDILNTLNLNTFFDIPQSEEKQSDSDPEPEPEPEPEPVPKSKKSKKKSKKPIPKKKKKKKSEKEPEPQPEPQPQPQPEPEPKQLSLSSDEETPQKTDEQQLQEADAKMAQQQEKKKPKVGMDYNDVVLKKEQWQRLKTLRDKIKTSLNFQNKASAKRQFDLLVGQYSRENRVSREQLIGGLQMYIEDQDPRTPQQRTIGFRPNNNIKTLTASGVVIADGKQTRQVITEQNQQLNDEIKELKEQLRLSKLEQERIRSNMTDTMKLELEKAENQRLQIAQERDIEIQKAKDMIKEQQERLAQEEKAQIKKQLKKQSDKLIEQTKQQSEKVIKKIKQSKSQLEKELEELKYQSEREQKELKKQYDEMTDKSSKDAQDLLKKLNDAELVRAEIQATLTQAQSERDLFSQKNQQLSKQLLDTTNLNAKQIKELERKNAEKQRQLTLDAEKRIKKQQLDIEQRNRKQLESITKLINKFPKQRNTILKIENQVRQNKNKLKSESKSKLLSKENVNAIVSTIPQEYRGSLGTTVSSLLNGNDLDMNSAVSGLFGLSLTFGTGMPIAGSLGSMAFNYVRDRLGIDMNNIFAEDREIQQNEQKVKQELEQLKKSNEESESIATQERIKSSELNKQLIQTRQKTQQDIKQLQLKQQTEIKQREAKLKEDLKKQTDKFTEQEKKLKQQHKTKLSEIDKQIKQIQNDRKKTDKSKEVQITKLTQQKDKLESDFKQSQQKIKTLTKQNKQYTEQLKKLKKDNDDRIKKLQKQIEDSKNMNELSKNELTTIRTESKKEIEKLEEQIQLLDQEKKDIQSLGQSSNAEQTKRYTQRLNELQKEKQSLQRELKQTLEVKQEIDNEITKLKTDVSSKANELKTALEDRTQIQSELDNINIQFQQARTNRTNLQSQLEQSQTNRTNLQSQLEQSQTNRTNLQSQLEQAQTNRTNLQSQLQKKDVLIGKYKSNRTGLIDRITNQESKINEQKAREELIIKKVNNQTEKANEMITQLDKNKTVLMDKNERLDLSLENSITENEGLRQNNTRLQLELKQERDKLAKQLQEQKRLEMLSMIEPDNSSNQDNNLYTNNIDMSDSKHGNNDEKINTVQLEEDVIIDEVKESMFQYLTQRVRTTASNVRGYINTIIQTIPQASIIAISENIRSGMGNPFQGLIPFRSSQEILDAVRPEEREAYEAMNNTLSKSDNIVSENKERKLVDLDNTLSESEDEATILEREDMISENRYNEHGYDEVKENDIPELTIRERLANIRSRMNRGIQNMPRPNIPRPDVQRSIYRVADRISQITGMARNTPNVLGYATDFVMRNFGSNIDFTSNINFDMNAQQLRESVSNWNGILSREGMRQGAFAGAVSGAQTGYGTTGTATGAIAGIIPGLLSGAIVGSAVRPALQRVLPNASPLTLNILSNIPPVLLGSYFGYSPTGDVKDIKGQGVLSGAGLTNITEEKIDANILKEQIDADHQEKQRGTGLFRPKFIIPSKEIFSQTQQQKYNDDVLFSLFDMVTEEGGLGGDSNPLVRSNNMNDDIRYKGAGITLENRLLFNKDITQKTGNKELDKMFLGNKLPPVKFVYQDPEDSFKFEANQFFVNSENTAVQMLSPYDDMTRTDQYWQTFPKSMLYSQVP